MQRALRSLLDPSSVCSNPGMCERRRMKRILVRCNVASKIGMCDLWYVIDVDGDRWFFQSMSTRSKRILNSMRSRHCLRWFSRDCHWSSFSMAVTLDLWSWLPVIYLALLRWTCSSFLMFRWVCGSHAAEAYSIMGLTYVLLCCLIDLATASAEVTLTKSTGGIGFFLVMTSMWVLKFRLLSICTPRYLAMWPLLGWYPEYCRRKWWACVS